MHLQFPTKQRAFTLAEMAVVVVIMSIVMTAGVKILLADLNSTAEQVTKERQEKIKEAIIDYVAKKKHLPCADTAPGSGPVSSASVTPSTPFDGTENRAIADDLTSNCFFSTGPTVLGIVPYQSLGLSQEDVIDGWQNYFSYRPETDLLVNASSFSDANNGPIIINTRHPGQATTTQFNATLAIISHGPTGRGAYTTKGSRNAIPPSTHYDERLNASGGLTIQISTPTEAKAVGSGSAAANDGGPYDDVVAYLRMPEIMAGLRKRGVVSKSIPDTMSDQLKDISRSIEGFILTNCVVPANLTVIGSYTTQDWWGRTITYQRDPAYSGGTPTGAFPGVSGSPTTTVYTLTSAGPDPNPMAFGDDITLQVSQAQLLGRLQGYANRCM